jgi:UDP-N-acetylmuramoyl-L-alanyl-D-glutamate--2,6-diaminopimelate ligase
MTLRDLIAGAGSEFASLLRPGPAAAQGSAETDGGVEVTDLAYRADAVSRGALFFCVRGFSADGHDFARDAVERGAVALVCERPLGLGVTELLVEDVRVAMPHLASSFFGHPTAELELVGITGTNGKTTTAFVLREILEASDRQAGLLGTVHSIVGGQVEPVERTTPESVDLQRAFRRMVDAGDRACVMEVSSHALELRRVDASHFDCAVFTNLSQDHLDFHETLEEYFGAKRRLFVGHATSTPRVAVVNGDDTWGRRLVEELCAAGHEAITFGVEREADFRAEDVELSPSGSRFRLVSADVSVAASIPLPGLFNVYNALGAIAAASTLGVELETACASAARAERVPGRFEPVDEGQGFSVLVDYAHTPDSLASVLETARELLVEAGSGRLICVFGAGGDRDREKRPLMGAAARRLGDHVIVTSDNPRSEDPDAIIAAIVEGAEQVAAAESRESSLEVEPDRRTAIARALALAQRDDIVLIAGKGHEQGQEFEGGRKVPFDDREVARVELRALARSKARPAA